MISDSIKQKQTTKNDELKEKCAVFGIYGAKDSAARVAYYGLWALQHRGQESSGIATSNGDKMFCHASDGLVAHVYNEENLDKMPGSNAIGHNRYATSGGASADLNQPFVDNKLQFAFAHNGNLPDTTKLEAFLKKHKVSIKGFNDSRMMFAAIGVYIKQGLELDQAIKKAFPLFTGVFSAVAMDNNKLVAFRDHCGIRPLSIATMDDAHVVASETCAFDTIGAEYLRDVEPGEMIVVDKDGLHSEQLAKGNQKLDIFEFVYFARPDSILMGQRVNTVRERFGEEMAREFPVEADVVIPIPDSSIPAALGYARESGIPFNTGLIKNRYIHRTFIQPTAELRKRDVKMKLNPVSDVLKDKRVVLVDDSIVRGTTMRQVIQMVRDAGAKELHILISSPPVRFPDFYGINTPQQNDLIAARQSVDEIREYLGADSLHFLSYNGMIDATNLQAKVFSMSCFDGVYPVDIGARAEEFEKLQVENASNTAVAGQVEMFGDEELSLEPSRALA